MLMINTIINDPSLRLNESDTVTRSKMATTVVKVPANKERKTFLFLCENRLSVITMLLSIINPNAMVIPLMENRSNSRLNR